MSTHHVIIGGGPAATNAIETLRELDAESRITLVSDEPAHSRMALPYWLAGQIPREHTLTIDDARYKAFGVDARIGVRVNSVDTAAKRLALSDGSELAFDRLLIATGSAPLALPVDGADLGGVQPMWTLEHTQSALDAVSGTERPRVVLVGAGFIGFIVLNAMHKRGWNLTVVERDAHVLPRMLNAEASAIVGDWLSAKGVGVHAGTSVKAIEPGTGSAKQVVLANGERVDADLVVVATGVKPNVDFIRGSGIEIDEGIIVDDRLQTSAPGIYAAGDVVQGAALFNDTPAIHAIQPTAIDHGRVAAANMAGEDVRYDGSLSMNVLDVCGLQCVSYGSWADPKAEAMTIANPTGHVYRSLLWTGDQITGAIFVGEANDLGMLTDVGMVKGIMQTQTTLGPWKDYLAENPFDIRRPYVAKRVAERLAGTTLIGRPAKRRAYRFGDATPQPAVGAAHAAYVGTRGD